MKEDLKRWYDQCKVFEDMLLEIYNYKDDDNLRFVENCADNISKHLESLKDNIFMAYGKITIKEKI